MVSWYVYRVGATNATIIFTFNQNSVLCSSTSNGNEDPQNKKITYVLLLIIQKCISAQMEKVAFFHLAVYLAHMREIKLINF